MAGKSLFPLTTTMAARLSREFGGRLRLSYAGGADAFNIDKLFACGIWPITMATTELKPGGYQRFTQIGEILDKLDFKPLHRRGCAGHRRAGPFRPAGQVPPEGHQAPAPAEADWKRFPCWTASPPPAKAAAPSGRTSRNTLSCAARAKYTEALALITEKNALPFTTGTICAHRCQTKCTRNYYDDPVQIRATKLIAAEKGYDDLMASLKKPEPVTDGRKAAIIGGGPTGIAAAYFLGRAGIPATVFEQSHKLGGVPRLVIPGFRISEEAIEKDIALMTFYGAEVKLNTPAPSVSELKAMGYTHIFFAVGAGKAGQLDIPGNVVPVIQWLRDLKAGKDVSLGHVAVVGGGNTAMDAARAALRAGAKTSTLVYRRTKKYMPADAGGAGAGRGGRRPVPGTGSSCRAGQRQAEM